MAIGSLVTRLQLGQTIAAATSIVPKSEYIKVTGTTAIATITPLMAGTNQLLYIVPSAAFTFTTAGNIAVTATAVAGKLMVLLYDKVTAKWYPNYVA